ncbi:MAG: 50S ribosomal protein L25 [Dehalococcoidales bacterium]|nr:50S ribosomal protein L25 [Dehalococcoidales bacterium]
MNTVELKATKRHIEGKKVKELRRQGITPAHLFGPEVESVSIQVDTPSLKRTLGEAGRTKLISLHIGREKSPRTVMVREVQIDSLKDEVLHVDFYQVQLTENIKVNVPIILTGDSAAAKAKGNTLVQELNELTIECLPASIPSAVAVDVSPLVTADLMIRVKDIQVAKEVTILNDPAVVVARIAIEVVEKEVEKPKAEGEAEGEAAEGEAPAEGEEAKGKKEPAEKAEKAAKPERKG